VAKLHSHRRFTRLAERLVRQKIKPSPKVYATIQDAIKQREFGSMQRKAPAGLAEPAKEYTNKLR